MSRTRTYDVFAYKQSDSPEASTLLAFVAPAEEIREWAGIPRRAEDGLVGFQRPDDSLRVNSAKTFFNTPPNQSPTSLIIGLHINSPGISLELEKSEDQTVQKGTLEIATNWDELSLEEIISRVRATLHERLRGEDEDADETEPADGLTESLEDGTDQSDVDDDDDARSVELGNSIIRDLLLMLDDLDWATANEEHLRELAKPATVIDGQHRLLGAQSCERMIPFQICAIHNCAWEEQVFQFTIVNYKQKGIPDQFITANAALSLTRSELDSLRDRLVQARVKVVEYELMKIVQFDERSPFFRLVNLTEKSAPHLIGYKTMVRVANGWYKANSPFFQLMLPMLYPDIKGKSARSNQRERWQEGDWGEFFLDYWRLVHEKYAAEPTEDGEATLWTVGRSQLMVAAVLLEFQNIFFQSLVDQDDDYFEIVGSSPLESMRAKLRKRAEKHLGLFPVELFTCQWKEKSLNTGAGRSALQHVFSQMKNTKGKWTWRNSALVKGQG